MEQRERELTELTRSVVADETRGHAKSPVDELKSGETASTTACQYHQEKQEAEGAADDNGALDSPQSSRRTRHAAAAAWTALPRLKAPRPTRGSLRITPAKNVRARIGSCQTARRAEALAELLEFEIPSFAADDRRCRG